LERIGVFICRCGTNIGAVVDVTAVVAAAKNIPGVVYAEENAYTCSETGQGAILKAIKAHNLERVVVASCSPRMHESTFRECIRGAGLNPYMFEMANIREQCSWVHPDKAVATRKALKLIEMAVAKTRRLEPLTPSSVGVARKALVIGGGIAGIQAALDISAAGYKVTMVERLPTIGGKMAQLDKTFPTLDCGA
jgi:heterodisulfide reductase subunit A